MSKGRCVDAESLETVATMGEAMREEDWRDLLDLVRESGQSADTMRHEVHNGLLAGSPLADGSEREEVFVAGLYTKQRERCENLERRLMAFRAVPGGDPT